MLKLVKFIISSITPVPSSFLDFARRNTKGKLKSGIIIFNFSLSDLYSIMEFVTTYFVSLCIEIPGNTGYQEPPMLL